MAHAYTNLTGAEGQDLEYDSANGWARAGSFNIDTTTKRSGTASFVVVTGGGIASYQDFPLSYGTSGNPFLTDRHYNIVSMYVRAAQQGNAANRIFSYLDGQTAGVVERAYAELLADMTIRLTVNGVGTTATTTTALIVADRWYKLDFLYDSGTASPNNMFRVRIDGVVEATLSGANGPTNDLDSFALGQRTAQAGVAHIVYYDDLMVEQSTALANIDYPPSRRVRRQNVESDGTYVAWTASAGSDFQCVDEVPPNGDADYIFATDLTAIATTVNLFSSGASGIRGKVLATALTALVRLEAFSPSMVLRVRSGGVDSDSAASTLVNSAYKAKKRVMPDDTNGGGAWTNGDLDGVEIGLATTASGTAIDIIRCTALDWSVAFIPGRAKLVPPGQLGPSSVDQFTRSGGILGG